METIPLVEYHSCVRLSAPSVRLLEVLDFFSKTIGSISSTLGTKYSSVKVIRNVFLMNGHTLFQGEIVQNN